jgi:hypothetical protein
MCIVPEAGPAQSPHAERLMPHIIKDVTPSVARYPVGMIQNGHQKNPLIKPIKFANSASTGIACRMRSLRLCFWTVRARPFP